MYDLSDSYGCLSDIIISGEAYGVNAPDAACISRDTAIRGLFRRFLRAKRYGPVISGVFKRRKLSEELTWPAGNHIIGPEHRQPGRTEHKRIRLCIPEIWICGLADRSVTGNEDV